MTEPAAITRCGTQALLMAVGIAASAGLIVAVGIVLTPALSFMVVGTAPFAALIVAVIAAATAGRRCNLSLAFWIGVLVSLLCIVRRDRRLQPAYRVVLELTRLAPKSLSSNFFGDR